VNRALLLLLPGLLICAQCSPAPPPTGQARADAQTLAACREHAEAVYDRLHRDTIYSIDNTNTPLSANYPPGIDRGLSQRYAHDDMVRDCVRNTGSQPIPDQPVPATP
jgi:hypothetical protein